MARGRPALVVVVALAVALAAAAQAAVLALRDSRPELALALQANDSVALVRSFDVEIAAGTFPADSGWSSKAVAALRAEPLSPSAVRLLALTSTNSRQGEQRARSLMNLSERLSRRDLTVQIWMIEEAVRRSSVVEALEHYDRALSVHPGAGQSLFPILTGALDTPEIVDGLKPYLRQNRPWTVEFLRYATACSEDLPRVVALFDSYGGSTVVPAHRSLESALLNRLVELGMPRASLPLAGRLLGADRAILSDVAMTPQSLREEVGPLSWVIGTSDGAEAVLAGEGKLGVNVEPDVEALLARRTMLLKPGRWRLRFDTALAPDSSSASLKWTMTCVMQGAAPELLSRDYPVTRASTTAEAEFRVGPQCEGVRFDAYGRSAGDTAAKFSLSHLSLTHGL